SYGVGSPGFGDCCTSLSIGASRHTVSSRCPSSVIEVEAVAAPTDGGSSPAARAKLVAAKKMQSSARDRCLLELWEIRHDLYACRTAVYRSSGARSFLNER